LRCCYDGTYIVEQPTVAGKTMQIVTILAMQLGRRFTQPFTPVALCAKVREVLGHSHTSLQADGLMPQIA
jgi:hypothetical protein